MKCYSIESTDIVMNLDFKEDTVDIYIHNENGDITDTFDFHHSNDKIIIEVNGSILYVLSQDNDCLVDERFGIKFISNKKASVI